MVKSLLTSKLVDAKTSNSLKLIILTLVAWVSFAANPAKAFCVYNLTNYSVNFTVNNPTSIIFRNVGTYNEATKSPRTCYGYADIGDGSRTRTIWVWVEIESVQFACGISMQAGGYLKVFEHLEENGVKKTVKVVSYTYDDKILGTYPKVSSPGNRDISFLATADPQYFKPQIHPDSVEWQQAYAVMTRLSTLMDYGNKYRGTIVAGDLTGYSRGLEFQEYERPFRDNHSTRFLYDGLGNHDFVCTGVMCTSLGYCTCPGPLVIAQAIGDRERSTPLRRREGPNYSWDWHDVHFAQLNLMPGNGMKETHKTYNSLDFLKDDLRENVGSSGRPVILIHHYGMDSFSRGCMNCSKGCMACSDLQNTDVDGTAHLWWNQQEREAYWNAIANYNVVLIITGHLHANSSQVNWWKVEWTRPAGLTNGPASIQTFTAGGAQDGGYYMDFQITNNEIIAKRYQASNLDRSLSNVQFMQVTNEIIIPITKPGEKPARLQPIVDEASTNQLITIRNLVDNRFLFDPGQPFVGARGSEGGWASSAPIVASDANYYNKADWYLVKNNDDTYFIVNNVSKRYLFATGEAPNGSEGGWTQSPNIVGSDYNYYELAKWRIQKDSDGSYYIINHTNNRYLFSTGQPPSGSEGGWAGSPRVVGSDASYYGKARWTITGPGLQVLD